jgi:hypothetical protein
VQSEVQEHVLRLIQSSVGLEPRSRGRLSELIINHSISNKMQRDTKMSYSLCELSIYVDIAIQVAMYHPLLFSDVTVCCYKQLLPNENCNTNSDRIPSAYGQVNLPFFVTGGKKRIVFSWSSIQTPVNARV